MFVAVFRTRFCKEKYNNYVCVKKLMFIKQIIIK